MTSPQGFVGLLPADAVLSWGEPVAVVCVGIPASGKSTFCGQHLSGITRINLDTLHTRAKEWRAVSDCLANGASFVVDNTNPTVGDRRRYVDPAKAAGYRVVGLFFSSVLRECLTRNATRTGKQRVPAAGVAAKSHALEIPKWDEGFDELYYVRIDPTGFVIEEWR